MSEDTFYSNKAKWK